MPLPGQAGGSPRSHWKLDLTLALLFLAIALATAPDGGIWARRVPIPQGSEHTNIAHALARGRGFADPDAVRTGPTAWVPPVWPAILALVYRTCGVDTPLASRVIIGLQHLLAAFALFALLRCLPDSGRWGMRAVLTGAFCVLAFPPLHILAMIDAEDLWIVWALLGSLLWLCTARGWGRARLLGFSVLGGLAVLTHAGAGLAVLVAAGVCVVVGRRHGIAPGTDWRPVLLRRLAFVYLGATVALGAWGWRNYRQFHALIPVKSTMWFELGLTLLPPGHSGVLTLSDMLLRHPFHNPTIAAHMAAVGEAAFMAEQRRAVMRFLRQHPGVLPRQIWHRAVNALAWPESPMDAGRAHIDLPASDWVRLQAAGLVRLDPNGHDNQWVYLGRPAFATLRRLATLPLQHKAAALRDRIRAVSEFQAAHSGWRSIGARIIYGPLPALCLLWALWRRRSARLGLLPYAALAYAVILLPNILITHNFSHQLRFIPLQAALIGATLIDLGGMLVRRTTARSRPSTELSSVHS